MVAAVYVLGGSSKRIYLRNLDRLLITKWNHCWRYISHLIALHLEYSLIFKLGELETVSDWRTSWSVSLAITWDSFYLNCFSRGFALVCLCRNCIVSMFTIFILFQAAFYDSFKNYDYTFFLGGSSLILSAVLCFPLRMVLSWERRRRGEVVHPRQSGCIERLVRRLRDHIYVRWSISLIQSAENSSTNLL